MTCTDDLAPERLLWARNVHVVHELFTADSGQELFRSGDNRHCSR